MKFRRCSEDSTWFCEIKLDKQEWPPLDDNGEWMDRPIRQWVYDNCYPGIFFSASGWILFKKEDNAIKFMLTWGST